MAVRGVVGSAEFRALLPDRGDRTRVEALVTRLYREMLQREPDAAGLRGWVDYIVASRDVEGAVAGFVVSAEFEGRLLTARQYVGVLYRALLGRLGDAGGLDAWEWVLRDTVQQVINRGFVPSPEFQGVLAGVCTD